MAGGDGSQAIVAAIAAEAGLPYACIPAGTRNHFALDLGVDRDDVVGALDAFVDGRRAPRRPRRGQRPRLRQQRLARGLRGGGAAARATARRSCARCSTRCRTRSAPTAEPLDLRWTGPDGREHGPAPRPRLNNPYRLGARVGSGTRPRLDDGVLGVAVFEAPARRAADAPAAGAVARSGPRRTFEVAPSGPVPAGVDGEAVVLDAPLRFRSRPGPWPSDRPAHPGASPSADLPDSPVAAAARLVRIAAGRPGLRPSGPGSAARGVGPPDRRGHAARGRRRLAAAAGTPVTAAMVFTAAGVLAGPLVLDEVDLSAEGSTVRTLAEATLALVLLSDAARVDLRKLRLDLELPGPAARRRPSADDRCGGARRVGLLGDCSWPRPLCSRSLLAPTDAALGQAVVTDPKVPERIRQGLNVESGLNDGICVPLLLIALAAAEAETAIRASARGRASSSRRSVTVARGDWASGRSSPRVLVRGRPRAHRRVVAQVVVVAGAVLAYGVAARSAARGSSRRSSPA